MGKTWRSRLASAGVALMAVAGTQSALADSWVKSQSDHFIVYSNAPSTVSETFLRKLEVYYFTLHELSRLNQGTASEDSPPFEIYLLRDRRDMAQVWPDISENVGGFYTYCAEGSAAYSSYEYNNYGARSGIKTGYDFSVLFHEYAHHFMFQNTWTQLPPWYVEGFAEYFSTADISGTNVTVGKISPERYMTLEHGGLLDYAVLLRGLPTTASTDDQLKYYAQSWLLAHYIMSSPERLTAFSVYIKAINGGDDPVAAFETAFKVKVADLSHILPAYFEKTAPTFIVSLASLPDAHIQSTQMPRSADHLLLWQSALKDCQAQKQKATLLDKIRSEGAHFPDDAWAQRVEARAEIVMGDPSKAQPILEAQHAASAQTAETEYLLGRTYFAEAMAGTDAKGNMQKARAAFGAAYRLAPLDPANLYYLSLAQSDVPGFPNANAVNAAVQAAQLAPSVTSYALRAADMLIRTDRMDEAALLLGPIASNPHAPAFSARIRTVLTAMQAGKPKGELLHLLAEAASDAS